VSQTRYTGQDLVTEAKLRSTKIASLKKQIAVSGMPAWDPKDPAVRDMTVGSSSTTSTHHTESRKLCRARGFKETV
jgi:hypothetical protein